MLRLKFSLLVSITLILLVIFPIALGSQTTYIARFTAPPEVTSIAQAQSLIYTLYLTQPSGSTGSFILTNVTCSSAPFNCQSTLPAGTVFVIDTKAELTAKTATSPESPKTAPFITGPSAPSAFSISR